MEILKNINLDIYDGELLTLLGPSGCGKTTILRLIGGFENPTSGEIVMNGKNINALPPECRATNTVFQSYALFPHMSAYDNIAFGLKMKNTSQRDHRKRGHQEVEVEESGVEGSRRQ